MKKITGFLLVTIIATHSFSQDLSIRKLQSESVRTIKKIFQTPLLITGSQELSIPLVPDKEVKVIGLLVAMIFHLPFPPHLIFMLFIKKINLAGIMR